MIPIRDINPRRGGRPVFTWSLIAINVLIFIYQLQLGGASSQEFVTTYGVVPFELTHGERLGALVTPLTSMFLHGGLMHLAGNMWFLHIFGDNVEDSMGPGRFLLFYLLCGLAAAGAQVMIDPASPIPMVGASGAIAGILAGYVHLFPRAKILTLVPILIFLQFIELRAVFFIFIWFGYQVLLGLSSMGSASQGGVAFFAHIGGFIAGMVLIRVMKRPRNPNNGWRSPQSARQRQRWH